MKYRLIPHAETKIVVLLEGEVEHDHGSGGYDKFLMEFCCWYDFLSWVSMANGLMQENKYMHLNHYHYHTYEMKIKKMTFSGTIERKMVRSYLDGEGKAIP